MTVVAQHVSATQFRTAGSVYEQAQASPEFRALRRRLRRFVFPMSALFLVWYLAYVLLASYARPFMARVTLLSVRSDFDAVGFTTFVPPRRHW